MRKVAIHVLVIVLTRPGPVNLSLIASRLISPLARLGAILGLALAMSPWGSPLTAQERPGELAAAAAGLRSVAGKHLTLFTDLPLTAEIESLPTIFDAAVPQWRDYFGIGERRTRDWRLTGFLMGDRRRFQAAGVLPGDLPPFLHGYCRGNEIWFDDQPSDYYRRHLMLHEGVHGFMLTLLGGAGPPWYMEGTAELLATHRWQDGQLTVNYFPENRDVVPYWGRVKLVQDEVAAGRSLSLSEVFRLDSRAHLKNEAYGWCWAAAALLDAHPRFKDRFRSLKREVNRNDDRFSQRFERQLGPELAELEADWRQFVGELDYGYDVERSAIRRIEAKALSAAGEMVVIAAAAGWQSSGILIQAGEKVSIAASGKYQVGDDPKPWLCEPQGVTIEYHRGNPLGMLMAAVAPASTGEASSPLQDIPIGARRELSFKTSGVLYFRINEASAGLKDNRGELSIAVARK
jgi:hypothetical protein